MPNPTISTATREEMLAARLALKEASIKCLCCGSLFLPKRKWQRYCSTRCRSMIHNTSKDVQLEMALGKISVLERQAVCLEGEIQELRAQLSSAQPRL